MKNLLRHLMVAVTGLGCATSTHAVPTLFLSDSVNSVTLAAGGVPVLVGAAGTSIFAATLGAGVLTWSGNVGTWIVNVSTGTTDPLTLAPYPHLDLNSVNASTGPSSLTIRWSDTDFGPSAGQRMKLTIGGTLSGAPGSSLTYNVYANTANIPLATTTLLASLGPFTTTAFSGTGFGATLLAVLGSPYSVSEEILLVHGGAGMSSFNAESQAVPDGGMTLALLGMALTGLEGLRRKMKARS